MRTRALTLTALVVLAAFVPFVGGTAVASSHEGELSLNESNVTLSQGESVWIAVQYDTAPGSAGPPINAIQFQLRFNSTVLNASNPQPGPYLTQDGVGSLKPGEGTDNSTGVVDYGEARKDDSGVTGAGDVAYVKFTATENTSKPLGALTSLTFETVKVSDPNQNSVPTQATGGTIDTVDTVPPTANATVQKTTVNVSEDVAFHAADSTDNHRIDSYEWDFDGDGTADATGSQVSTSFDSTGTKTVAVTVTDADGNTDTDTVDVQVVDEVDPTAAVTATTTTVELGDPVTLDGSDSTDNDAVASYEWDFTDDGTVDETTTSPSVDYTYGDRGTFTANLTVVDPSGNTDTATVQVTVEDTTTPSVSVAPNTTEQTLGAPVEFDASGTTDNGAVASYAWDFDEDGQIEQNTIDPVVTHTFDTRGTYNVSVTATDEAGNSGTGTAATVSIVDGTAPIAVVEGPEGALNVSEAGTFDASNSTDNTEIDSYEWTFGDGSSATGVTVDHAYDAKGNYTVTLTVTDVDGNTDTASTSIEVGDGVPPSASATVNRTSAGLNVTTVSFDASGSSDNDAIASYEWDFDGDGAVETTTTAATTTYVYPATGTFTPEVTVVDASGNTDTATTADVTVADTTAPDASATVNATDVFLTDTVGFDASQSTDNGQIVAYRWDVDGDGTVDATTSSPTYVHSYDARGSYTPTVRVVDAANNSATATMATVNVTDGTPPEAAVATPSRTVDVNVTTTFDASPSTDNTQIDSYAWAFGDGSSATGVTFDHAYDAKGNYTVTLTVTDVDGNTNTTTASVAVVDRVAPTATATVNRTSAELNRTTVAFDASGSSDNDAVDSYEWDFDGDDTVDETTTSPTTTHVFAATGTFTPEVTVVDASGNTDTATTSDVTVSDTIAPTPAITGPQPAVVNITSTFDASNTTDNGPIASYEWDFDGDGTTNATTADPTADTVYTVPDRTLTVTVTVTDEAGNTATTEMTVNTTRAPGVSVVDPTAGEHVNVSAPTVAYEIANRDADDVDHAEYRVDGGTWQTASDSTSGTNGTVTLASLADGEHTVEFRLVNGSGVTLPYASSTTAQTFTVDTVAPGIQLVGPQQGRVAYGTNLSFAYDDASAVTATFQRNTTGDATANVDDTVVATDGWPEGPTAVTVTATDEAGNTANETFTFDFVSAPDVDSVAPANGTLLNDTTPTVEVTYSDDDVAGDSGIDPASVTLSANGQSVSLADATVTPDGLTVTLPDRAVSDTNTQTLVAEVADNASHTTTASWTFTVDNRAPRIAASANHSDRVSTNYPVAVSVDVTETHPGTSTAIVRNASTGTQVATLAAPPADGSGVVTWNATDDSGVAVASGTYEVVVTSEDAVNNTATKTVNVTVDTVAPTVSITEVTGPNVVAGTVVTNGTVTFAADAGGTPGDAENVTFVLSAWDQNYELAVPASLDNGSWTATADISGQVPDDGAFAVSAVATDPAKNTNTASSGTLVELDRRDPALGATVSRVNTSTAQVNVSVTNGDTLDTDSLVVQLRTPNGSTTKLDVQQVAQGRYTATFAVNQSGLYSGIATATDEAGNRGTDSFGTVLETVSTTNKTVTVYVESSGSFIEFNTSAEVNDTFVTITDSSTPLEPLAADLRGARFIDGELGDALEQNLTNATIGLPVNESALPTGVSPSDVAIRYYNPDTDSWEEQPTRIAEVTLENGVTDTYYLTTVTHFSTYGATVQDTAAPTLSSTSPASGTEYPATTDEVTARFEYSDDLTGVDASAVTVSFDGTDVTDAAGAQVTSEYATYTATGLQPGTSHTVAVTVVDEAGNSDTFTTDYTVTTDETPPTVSLDPSDGATVSTSSPTLSATYSDAASSIDTASVEVKVDGQTVTGAASVSASGVSYDASGLSDGSHTFTVSVADAVGQTTTKTASFTVQTASGSTGTSSPSTGTSSPSSGSSGGSAPVAPSGTPNVTQVDAGVSTTEVEVGDTLTVTATFENTGTADAEQTVELFVDGEPTGETRTVRVPENGSATATFGRSFDAAGTYTIAVGNLTAGTVTVVEPTTATPTVTPDDSTPTTPATPASTPSETITATPTRTPTATGTPTASDGPGFTALLALVGLLAAGLLARRD
ncbi:PKD domain-containing protein [Halorarius litoreus]|uniref:PKD domain-containing protein n=1 Tax=Halorarius litoreus TaxID=2962676 RepID=UPI0020CF3A00|nr:PKD domain-containing protein [Halorarius litoreus]